jgi:hypothetical protein
MTVRIHVTGVFYLLIVCLTGRVLADDSTPANTLDPSIHRVEVVGKWSMAGEFGRYRIVKMEVMGEHALARAEMQWLADEPAHEGGKVIKSVPLDEVGLPILSNITWTIRRISKNRLELRVSGILPDAKKGSWDVTALEPGRVQIGPRLRLR